MHLIPPPPSVKILIINKSRNMQQITRVKEKMSVCILAVLIAHSPPSMTFPAYIFHQFWIKEYFKQSWPTEAQWTKEFCKIQKISNPSLEFINLLCNLFFLKSIKHYYIKIHDQMMKLETNTAFLVQTSNLLFYHSSQSNFKRPFKPLQFF